MVTRKCFEQVCSSLPDFLIAKKHSGLLALRLALLFYYQLYISLYNLLALLPSLDAMQSCLLTPFTGVNIEAIGHYAIIFDVPIRKFDTLLSIIAILLVVVNHN